MHMFTVEICVKKLKLPECAYFKKTTFFLICVLTVCFLRKLHELFETHTLIKHILNAERDKEHVFSNRHKLCAY